MTSTGSRSIDADHPLPVRADQEFSVPDDLVLDGVFDLDGDERLWIPQADGVAYRPILFHVSAGYFVNLLRVRRSGVLRRHRHTGSVHAFNLRGRWHYLEHDWWAEQGAYVYEPPGGTHTLEVPGDVEEMVTLFHVTGSYVYLEPDGTLLAIEDVYTKLGRAREHYDAVGLGADLSLIHI